MGEYGLANNRGQLTNIFQPSNPVAFDIKNYALERTNLREWMLNSLMSILVDFTKPVSIVCP